MGERKRAHTPVEAPHHTPAPHAPAHAPGVLAEWRARLETDRAWSARLRAELAQRACDPCDLVLIIARPAEYPRMRAHAPVIEGSLIVVGTVAEVLDSPLPVANLQDLIGSAAHEQREQAHAILLDGVNGSAFRFTLPR